MAQGRQRPAVEHIERVAMASCRRCPRYLAPSKPARLAGSCGMPTLIRRRSPDAREKCWQIFYGDVGGGPACALSFQHQMLSARLAWHARNDHKGIRGRRYSNAPSFIRRGISPTCGTFALWRGT